MHSDTKHSEIKADLYKKLGTLTAAMGAPVRLRLIQILSQSPRTVEDLSRETGESFANTSQHLQKLYSIGIITYRKEGLRRVYSIANRNVSLLWESIQDLAEELIPEIITAEEELTDKTLASPVAPERVIAEIKGNNALLLDVRDRAESESTPVKRALSFPLDSLENEIENIPSDKTVFVFCRGRFCTLATEAVRFLRSKGYEAYRLKESANRLNQITEAL